MNNKNDKIKKWLIAAGGIAICAVLVAAIGSQFKKEKPVDAPLPNQSTEASDVTVEKENTDTEKEVIVAKPEIMEPESTDTGAASTGMEQTIQEDVEKPKEPAPPKAEDGKDRTPPKTESGKDHEFTPESSDAPPSYKAEETEKKPAESKPSGGGNSIPGFDNVPDLGANQGEVVDGDGDINKQVGTMD